MTARPHALRFRSYFGLLLLLWLSLGTPAPTPVVRADAGPELQGPTMVGSVISPYQFKSTQVQMVDEQVVLRLEAVPTKTQTNSNFLVSQVFVTATFHMRNTSAITESMAAVFPLTELQCPVLAGPGAIGSMYEHALAAASFKVQVDKQAVPTKALKTTTVISPAYPELPPLECKTDWQQFNVTFPPKKDVSIVVTYRMEPTYYAPYGYPWTSFTYILKTGAPWHGPIQQIDLTLQLPYTPTTTDILQMPPKGKQQGRSIAWQWRNAEPKENVKIVVMSPQMQQAYAASTQQVKTTPQDPVAWAALAQLNEQLAGRYDYAGICTTDISGYWFSDITNWAFAQAAVKAYKQALSLQPNNGAVQSSYAKLLGSMSLSGNRGVIRPEYTSTKRAIIEFNRALALLQNDEDNYTLLAWNTFQICMDDDLTTRPCGCGY